MNEPQRHVDNRIDETLMMLRAAAIEQGMAVSGDNRVGEDPGPEVAKPVSTLSMFSVEPTMPSPEPWGRHEAVHATSSAAEISIVFAAGNGPVADGIVASLNRPGGNITGITSIASELGSKRSGLLRELLPDIRTISLQAVVLVVPRVHRASRSLAILDAQQI